ncbi:MAG: DUF4421 family protein [Bacteroidota bacterium]
MNRCSLNIMLTLLLLFIGITNGFTQVNKDTMNCVYKFPHRITFKTYFSSSDLYYTIRDKDAKYKPAVIIPNSRNNLGFSLSYKSLGASYSVRIEESPYSERRFGKTKYYDFRLNYFYKIYGFDGYLQHYKGLYQKNPQSFYPNFSNTTPYPQFPNMAITTFGFNAIIKKNKCFSYKSIYYQSERQKHSVGSLVLMLNNRVSRIKNDNPYTPASAVKYMPEFSKCNKGTFLDFALAPGYVYTYVKNNYFINGSMYAGLGEQLQLYTRSNAVQLKFRPMFKYNFRATAGYNGDDFFYKISYDIDLNTIRFEDSRQNILLSGLDFTVGLRIK